MNGDPPVTTADPPWPEREASWRHDAPDPPDAFPVPWSWVDGLVLIAILFVTGVVVGVIGSPFLEDGSSPVTLTVTAASQLAGLLAGGLWLRVRGAWSWRLLGPLRPQRRHLAIGVAAGLIGWLFVLLLLAIVLSAAGLDELPQQETLQIATSGGVVTAVLATLVAVILAPVLEEGIYRGVLFQALRARLGLWPGIGISSLVFASLHLEVILTTEGAFEAAGLISMSGLAVFGAWLAGVFHRTGSLVVPIVAHAVFNGVGLLVAWTAGSAAS